MRLGHSRGAVRRHRGNTSRYSGTADRRQVLVKHGSDMVAGLSDRVESFPRLGVAVDRREEFRIRASVSARSESMSSIVELVGDLLKC